MIPFEERRTRRSNRRDLALSFQLSHMRDRGRMEAVVLADKDGLIVANSGENAVCRELAAIAPLVARSIMGLPMPPMLRGADVAVRSLKVHDQNLYLATVGGGVARDALLNHSTGGVQRILSTN